MLWLLLLLAAAPAAALEILAADVPPLIFQREGQLRGEGYCADIVYEIQRRLHGDAPVVPVRIQPWPRVLARGQQEPDLLLICPKRTPERATRFQWVGAVLQSRSYFYARSGVAAPRLASLDEARALTGVLLPRASYFHELLGARGFRNLVEIPGTGMTGLKMLMAGRYPALVMEDRQMTELLREAGLAEDAVRPALLSAVVDSDLAFSLGTPPERVRAWRRVLAEMKRDGGFERIYRQWFQARPPAELLVPLPQQ